MVFHHVSSTSSLLLSRPSVSAMDLCMIYMYMLGFILKPVQGCINENITQPVSDIDIVYSMW